MGTDFQAGFGTSKEEHLYPWTGIVTKTELHDLKCCYEIWLLPNESYLTIQAREEDMGRRE